MDAPAKGTAVEGELPSVGSAAHFDGSCKRCAFYPKGRCQNGSDCTHCHFDHQPRTRIRKSAAAKRAQKEAEEEPKDDLMEADTTANSASAASDGEEGATLGLTDSEKASVTHAESSDSDLGPQASTVPVNLDRQQTDSEHDSSSPRVVLKEKKLGSSPTSWAAQQRTRKLSSFSEDLPVHDIGRMVRALLNKLTEERFESLASQLLALPFSTQEQLNILAAEIFEKATAQDGFRSLYTELCKRIDMHLAEKTSAIGGKAFRAALVNECQATFERSLVPPDAASFAGLGDDERLEAEIKLKTTRLGNMRFIGELLVRRLLAPKLLPPIIQQLMNGDEAMLESLIALLTIVGPSSESQSASMSQVALKDACITLRRKISNKPSWSEQSGEMPETALSARLRCQITDLLEARGRGWTPRSS
jgi:histone H3/H4